MRDVPHDRRYVDDAVTLQHTQLVIVEEQQLHVECSLSRLRFTIGKIVISNAKSGTPSAADRFRPSRMTMAFAPLVYGYEDTIADLVVDRLGEVSLAGRVFDQQYLAGADLAALAVARGDLHARVEIDDVLTSGGGVPVEIIGRRNFAEDDAGCRQAFGKLAAARLLDPLDLDVPEVRLPAPVSVEVVYPHWRPPSGLPERVQSNVGADRDASVSTQSRR